MELDDRQLFIKLQFHFLADYMDYSKRNFQRGFGHMLTEEMTHVHETLWISFMDQALELMEHYKSCSEEIAFKAQQ